MRLSQEYRIRFYVSQDAHADTSIEHALGAVRRHLKTADVYPFTFTMATANERVGRVCVTIKTRDHRALTVERHIKQDYPQLFSKIS